MKIIFNGNERILSDPAYLYDLLSQLKVREDKPGVAVAINNDIIAQSDWQCTKLKENDRIEIIQAVQGG
jgi:sulfur carrier protein